MELNHFRESVIKPLNGHSRVTDVVCFPDNYLAYREYMAAASLTPLDWREWLEPTRNANTLPAQMYGRAYRGNESGEVSGVAIPTNVLCEVWFIDDTTNLASDGRIEVMQWFQNLATTVNGNATASGKTLKLYFYSFNWAMKVGLDEVLPRLTWTTIAAALITVAILLLVSLPLHSAIISTGNILLIVLTILAFMGLFGYKYNLVSYCTITMAIGFCVDYTCEIMQFSLRGGPEERTRARFYNALRLCGYDVFHGGVTALIGVTIMGFIPAPWSRIFSYMCMVMCITGVSYALLGLPACMMIAGDLTSNQWIRMHVLRRSARGMIGNTPSMSSTRI